MPQPIPPFDTLYREFRPRLLRYLAGVVNPDEAPDLAQVALMKVSEHLHEFRGESSLSTWVYRIATNVALDRLRQRTHAAVGLPADSEESGEPATVPPELRTTSTEADAERREMSACVREFIVRLPSAYRGVVLLSEIEGFSNAEIAQVTGLTLDTVKVRLHRGRARLRAEIEKGCVLGRRGDGEVACERPGLSVSPDPYPFARRVRRKG